MTEHYLYEPHPSRDEYYVYKYCANYYGQNFWVQVANCPTPAAAKAALRLMEMKHGD